MSSCLSVDHYGKDYFLVCSFLEAACIQFSILNPITSVLKRYLSTSYVRSLEKFSLKIFSLVVCHDEKVTHKILLPMSK